MSTKALRKELFAAVAMLIVAAIALSGSTYAWFAANTTVEATDMQVTVTSDTTFLLIGQGHMAVADIQNGKAITTSASITTASIMPSAHQDITIGEGQAKISDIEANSVWYYRYSSDPANATASMTAIQPLTYTSASAIPGGYLLVNEFALTVASGSNEIQNLKVSECAITSTSNAAVKVVVATDEGSEEFGATVAGGVTTVAGTQTLAASITSSAAEYVKVYIYWNGDDEDVYTNNIANLIGTSVVLTFTGTPAPAN